ncbi:D-sedoheptulose-7-phosphate isomerase [Naasia aerilata]|uniref:Phosphoheptose isomerase n=1 Tax=Naasia aerilata TaxID=1162966 RepID=A0ABM8GCU9_9MICO|nr:SIS domain-containing protein [Naasia aerilata]BDZ46084.1 phosphoheptose isomerase [Naasia aerilata]
MSDAPARDWMNDQLDDLVASARAMEELLPTARSVADLLIDAYGKGGILYTFGNGGSAADAQHFSEELVGHYKRDRRPLGAVNLAADPMVLTCIANDYSYDEVFSRPVEGLARPGDVVAAFTTSGKSPNVVAALQAARRAGATTVLFAGGDGGPSLQHADHVLLAPSSAAPRIQELHTFLLHVICEAVDAWAAGESAA